MKIAGIALVVVGLVWCLQGAGLLGGSFMTGRQEWLVIGIAAAVGGLAILIRGLRRNPPS